MLCTCLLLWAGITAPHTSAAQALAPHPKRTNRNQPPISHHKTTLKLLQPILVHKCDSQIQQSTPVHAQRRLKADLVKVEAVPDECSARTASPRFASRRRNPGSTSKRKQGGALLDARKLLVQPVSMEQCPRRECHGGIVSAALHPLPCPPLTKPHSDQHTPEIPPHLFSVVWRRLFVLQYF